MVQILSLFEYKNIWEINSQKERYCLNKKDWQADGDMDAPAAPTLDSSKAHSKGLTAGFNSVCTPFMIHSALNKIKSQIHYSIHQNTASILF